MSRTSFRQLFIGISALLMLLISACGSTANNSTADTASHDRETSVETEAQSSSSAEKTTPLQDYRIKVNRIRCDKRVQTLLYTDNGDPVIELGAGSNEAAIFYDPDYFDLLTADGTPVPPAEGRSMTLDRYITTLPEPNFPDEAFFRLDFGNRRITDAGTYTAVLPIMLTQEKSTIEIDLEVLADTDFPSPVPASSASLIPENSASVVIKKADIYADKFNTYRITREKDSFFFAQLEKMFSNVPRREVQSDVYGPGKIRGHDYGQKFIFYDADGNWMNELFYYGEFLEYQGRLYETDEALSKVYGQAVSFDRLKKYLVSDVDEDDPSYKPSYTLPEEQEQGEDQQNPPSSNENSVWSEQYRITVTDVQHNDFINTILYTDNGDARIEMGAASTSAEIHYDPTYIELFAEDGTSVPSGSKRNLKLSLRTIPFSTPLDEALFHLDLSQFAIPEPGKYRGVIPVRLNHTESTLVLTLDVTDKDDAPAASEKLTESLVPDDCSRIILKNADPLEKFSTYLISREKDQEFFSALCRIFSNRERQPDTSGLYGSGGQIGHEQAVKFVFRDDRDQWIGELYYYGPVLEYQGKFYEADEELQKLYQEAVSVKKLKEYRIDGPEEKK